MERIKKKVFIGLIFAVMAVLVNVGVKVYNNLDLIAKDLGFNFILFFLIGYVVLGNLFANKKAN
ncbi:hypothetical protein [Wenyingzhuangia sp. IMCC45467]